MKKILLPLLSIAALSACDDAWNREGVGFTGLDGEPATIEEAVAQAGVVSQSTNIPAELAAVPTIRVSSEATEPDKMAGVAVNNGGRTPANAVEVSNENQTLMLSTVQVNDTLYAVLRPAEGDTQKIGNSVGVAFAERVERLTGCVAAGDAFRKGRSSRRTSGVAVPLNCS